MIPNLTKQRVIPLLLSMIMFIGQAGAGQKDLISTQLTRTVEQSNQLSSTLSKSIYRTEVYDDTYVVDVPYEEVEWYDVDVPYTEEETYTDWEDYYDWEQVCRNRTEYDEKCETQRKCEPVLERRCETKNVCDKNPSVTGLFFQLIAGSQAFADDNKPNREDQERRRREQEERRNQERENRERENRDRQERANRDREEREKQNRERQERESRDRQEREKRDRDNQERQKRDRENQEREKQERDRQEREKRERENRDQQEKERRDREERDRREREGRDQQDKERREREERERREREGRDQQDREKRDREERERRDREEREKRDRDEQERRRRCNREKCEMVKVGENCKDDRVCRKVPRVERHCEMEQVRKTRPVTKTRLVTRWRTERRWRTVTRHRQEERCCVKRERQVFDHQYSVKVNMLFPTEAQLVGAEKEIFNIELQGTEESPEIQVTPVSALFKYSPQVVQNANGEVWIQMNLVPTYQPGELDEKVMSDFELLSNGGKVRFNFIDRGLVNKVQTKYDLFVTDPATGLSLGQFTLQGSGNGRVKWDLDLSVKAQTPLKIDLQVQRQGPVLAASENFVVTKDLTVKAEEKYDTAPYMDKNMVGKFSMSRDEFGPILNFRDLTKDIPQVKTVYNFRVSLQNKEGLQVLAEKAFGRESLKPDSDGRLPLSLSKDFGIADGTVKAGQILVIEGAFWRYGTLFPDEKFSIPKKVTLEVQ